MMLIINNLQLASFCEIWYNISSNKAPTGGLMKIPEKIVDCIEMLLEPYPISFKEMLTRYQSASPEEEVEESWITLLTAAKFAKVSTWTMRRWCRRGVISRKTSTARCGRILINKGSLIKFLENLPR